MINLQLLLFLRSMEETDPLNKHGPSTVYMILQGMVVTFVDLHFCMNYCSNHAKFSPFETHFVYRSLLKIIS